MLIRYRILAEALYIVEYKATIRETAKFFGVNKSTVYTDVTAKLSKTNLELAMRVKEVLKTNKAERHIRGGIATKKKYQRKEVKE